MNSFFYVKNKTLLLIAGVVWQIAGFNVIRLGILSYMVIDRMWYLYLLLRHHLQGRNHEEDEHEIQFFNTFHYLYYI